MGENCVPHFTSFRKKETPFQKKEKPDCQILKYPRNTFVWPADHSDGRAGNDTRAIPMGARLRLRSNVSLERLGTAARVIATAMKLYGIQFGDSMVAGWATDGVPDARWNDTDLKTLRLLKPADFDWVWPPFLPWPPGCCKII